VAKQFQEFLGCPEAFQGNDVKSDPSVKYVSPARAKWDVDSGQFTLVAYQNIVEEVDFRDDGNFYFGLRVFLEHGPTTYPKQDFWFLLRGKQEGSSFSVCVVRETEKCFKLTADTNDESGALYQHLFECLKGDLATSPISRAAKKPFRIGFTADI
jgi:hypothetical protein